MDEDSEKHFYKYGPELYSYELPDPVADKTAEEQHLNINDELDAGSSLERLNKLLKN